MNVNIVISDDKKKAAIIFDKEAFPYVGAFLNSIHLSVDHDLWNILVSAKHGTYGYNLPQNFKEIFDEIITSMQSMRRHAP